MAQAVHVLLDALCGADDVAASPVWAARIMRREAQISVLSGKLKPQRLITHELDLDDLMKAYALFENAAQEKALKVLIKGG